MQHLSDGGASSLSSLPSHSAKCSSSDGVKRQLKAQKRKYDAHLSELANKENGSLQSRSDEPDEVLSNGDQDDENPTVADELQRKKMRRRRRALATRQV